MADTNNNTGTNNQIRPDLLYTIIYPPSYKKELRYAGYTRSFSASNEKGPFDILPMHENFVSVISGAISLVDDKGIRKEFLVENAVIEASEN